MASIKLTGDTSGEITIAAPAVAGTNTLTLPAHTGTVMVDGPAFSATASSNQTITTNTITKLVYNIEDFDTNSNYDTSNYRFTPTVAGYYQFNYNLVANNATAAAESWIAIYKNGSNWQWGLDANSITTHYWTLNGSALIYLNGSTDYVEIYMSQATGSNLTINPNASLPMRFSGFLARAS